MMNILPDPWLLHWTLLLGCGHVAAMWNWYCLSTGSTRHETHVKMTTGRVETTFAPEICPWFRCVFFYMIFIVNTCCVFFISLRWRHNDPDGVSSHQPYDYLLNRLFRHRSKKTSKLRVTGLCVGNSPETGEFPAQMASNAENVSIWWRHHVLQGCFADTEANVANVSGGSLDYMGRNNH